MKNWTYKNFTIHEFNELSSTNSQAFGLANSRQISENEIILARAQTQGRGRKDRTWISPSENLYFSLVLRPKISAAKISQISFIAITALRNSIAKIANNSVLAKWPNDLLIDEKKVAGLLLESKISGENCEFVVLGIGLNIESNPDNVIFLAGNLKDFGITISIELALQNFLDEFEKLYQNWHDFGFKGIRKLWLENAYKLGEKITVKLDEEKIEGIFEDLDEEGNLLLKTGEKVLKISAADVA